jgi:cytoskeletal protein CcmA (bactofilin family)
VFGAVAFVYAQEETRKIVSVDEVIDGDYVAAGETVEISGVVRGDVYVLGGQVLISGIIEGDLLALGGTVSISGRVDQNVRVAGWQVIISGEVGRNATVGAMNIEVTKRAHLQGSMVAGAANVILNSPIQKATRIAGRNLTVTNVLASDLDAAVENIRLGAGAEIKGDFTYWSNRSASIGENVVIQGEVTKKAAQGPGAYVEKVMKPITEVVGPLLGIVSFLSSLIIGAFLVKLFPDFARKTVVTLRTRKWRSLTSGVTTLLIIPIVFGILIITIVGIPLGFVLLMLSSLILYVARIFIMLLIGMLIAEKLNKNISDVGAFIIGLVVYSLLVQLPIVGWLISFLAVLFGLGAVVQTVKEKYFANRNLET